MEGDSREFSELPMEGVYVTLRVPFNPSRDVSLEEIYQRFRARMEAEKRAEQVRHTEEMR
jgi:hypothetical protein